MQIIDYKYIKPTEKRNGYFAIPELTRDNTSVNQFIKLSDLDISLKVPTGFIYVDGFTLSQAESGIGKNTSTKYSVAVCSGTSYAMHKWISQFSNNDLITTAVTTTGTCASGIQALSIAESWMSQGLCEEVIVIGGERITSDTLRLFKELRIPIMCGDGFAYMRLGKTGNDIKDIKWKYKYSSNAFYFSKDSINTLCPEYVVDYVKLHGTGSKSNTEAEEDISKLGIPLQYKNVIGHTQGISALLEMCMVLDDNSIKGTTLVLANGVGGFYGSCTLMK